MFLPDFPEKIAKELCRIPFREQLKSRRILKIKKLPPGWLAKGSLTSTIGGFVMEIRPSMSMEESALTFGHELGHTYFYSDDQLPRRFVPKDSLDDPPTEKAWCDNFAKEWLDNLSSKDRRLLVKLLKPLTEIKESAPRDLLRPKRYFH